MSFTNRVLPEKLYYDVVITNLNNDNTAPPIAYFNETRSSPFVSDPEQYYMSIIRFTLDTPTLPVLIPEIKPFSTNVNDTIYSLTLQWQNPVAPFQVFTSQRYVQFAPQDLAVGVPLPPSQTNNGLQNNKTGYYDIYNYQYWIYLINQTFLSAFNNLNAQVIASGLVLPSVYPPVLTYDTTNNIAILNSDLAGYSTINPNHIQMYFNSALHQQFSSFPFYIKTFNDALGRNYQIQTNTFGGANTVQFPPTAPLYTAIETIQEYSTVALWTPVASIVFCSNTLPIVSNQLSSPLLYINGIVLTNSSNNSNISQIITDFVSDDGIYKPNIVYQPTAQYRLVELLGNRPIYTLDLTIFWKDKQGQFNPFRLSAGSSATIKFLFTRKDTVINK